LSSLSQGLEHEDVSRKHQANGRQPSLDLGATDLDHPGPLEVVEVILRVAEAFRTGNWERLQRLADSIVPPPLVAEIAALAVRTARIGSLAAREDLHRVLRGLCLRHQARLVAASRDDSDPIRPNRDPLQRFQSLGDAAPNISDWNVYFSSPAGKNIILRTDLDGTFGGLAVHVLGYVHSGASDNFAIRIIDAEPARSETLRFGTHGVTLESDKLFYESAGNFPCLYSLIVVGDTLCVHVNGLLLWRLRRSGTYQSRSVEFALWQSAAGGGDFLLSEYQISTFSQADDDAYFGKEVVDTDERLGWFIRHDERRSLYALCRTISNVSAGKYEAEALAYMEHLARSEQGYCEWAVTALRQCLSSAGREKWDAAAKALLPTPVIRVEDLNVRLHKDMLKSSLLLNRFRGERQTFLVLEGIDFAVYPGDVVGIVGHNGAGKSTLLRTIAGLVPIERGHISVAQNFMLLRAGLGIQTYLTGRENIVSAGVYMGLTPKEAEALIPDVIEVSELADHIDRPVKYYSDGMLSRLIFAIATSLSPDLLLLDELLGAGDVGFQEKAQARLEKFLKGSKSVVIVTHSLQFVREHCNKALVLSHGKQVYFGEPHTAVSAYLNDLHMSLTTRGGDSRF
jgi:ABC-type polysaccharide/polyol phosphate transport system ATPase subunit